MQQQALAWQAAFEALADAALEAFAPLEASALVGPFVDELADSVVAAVEAHNPVAARA